MNDKYLQNINFLIRNLINAGAVMEYYSREAIELFKAR